MRPFSNPQAYFDGVNSVEDDLDKNSADYLLTKALKQVDDAIAPWLKPLGEIVSAARTPQELQSKIPSLYNKLTSSNFESFIYNYRLLAQLAGRFDVLSEIDEFNQDASIPGWLKLKFQPAIDYFRRKVVIPTNSWQSFTADQHDWAFTISGMTKARMLQDARDLVDDAIANGADFEVFKNQWNKKITDKGWRANEHGVYTILDTNLRRAYGAGRYQQINESQLPYIIWKHRNSPQPRPNHLALHNKAIPSNHKFWKVAFPICAWGCRCTAFGARESMLSRLGATILNNPPDPKLIADPSFQRAPGSSPQQERKSVVEEGTIGLDPELRTQAEKDMRSKGII